LRGFPNLGQIFGIRIRLHYTWSIAFILIVAAVVTQFPEVYPLWQRMIVGIGGCLLFLIAISIRELVLTLLAISKGISVKRVTLFVFGGVPQITREGTVPVLELLLAAAGLLSNLLIAGMFYGVHVVLVNAGNIMIEGLIQWLAFICFMLALFHFIPGFPLDGGRVLRAILWRATGNYDRVTRIVSWTGRGIGLLLFVGGILLLIITQQWFVGILLAFPGWVLQSAAAQSHRQAVVGEALEGIMAGSTMSKECPFASPQVTISQLVQNCILVTGQRYFVVVDGVQLQGIVTMRSIKSIPKERWDSTRIGEIMTPASELRTAHPEQTARSVLEQMDELETNQMPVLEDDKVIGIVTRDSLIRTVKAWAELHI